MENIVFYSGRTSIPNTPARNAGLPVLEQNFSVHLELIFFPLPLAFYLPLPLISHSNSFVSVLFYFCQF